MPYIDTKDVISQSFKNLMEKKSFDVLKTLWRKNLLIKLRFLIYQMRLK